MTNISKQTNKLGGELILGSDIFRFMFTYRNSIRNSKRNKIQSFAKLFYAGINNISVNSNSLKLAIGGKSVSISIELDSVDKMFARISAKIEGFNSIISSPIYSLGAESDEININALNKFSRKIIAKLDICKFNPYTTVSSIQKAYEKMPRKSHLKNRSIISLKDFDF